MAFTQLNLQTQQLLESTFISDMRIIINANTILLKNIVQDAFNSLEIDTVNKKIGVDNPLSSIYTNDLRIGNSLAFTDGTTVIGQLTKAAGKSRFELDQIKIKAGGSIDALGLATKIAVTRLGIGVADLNALTTDGLVVASGSALTVQGQATFSNSIVESFETVTSTLSAVSGNPNAYECDITLNATSKSNIELAFVYPITDTAANGLTNPVIIVNVYTNTSTPPTKGQAFTFYVKSIQGNNNVNVDASFQNSATVRISGGYDATKNRVLINQQAAAATAVGSIAGPYLKFNAVPGYGGAGSLTLVDSAAVPMRFVTTSVAGLCEVAQS
jgi:hypothetical protein